MEFLNDNMQDALLSLDGEKMFVETIMRDTVGDREYLYWYSIQADDGDTNSEVAECIDRRHLSYWNRCIDKAYRPRNLQNEVVMIQTVLKIICSTLKMRTKLPQYKWITKKGQNQFDFVPFSFTYSLILFPVNFGIPGEFHDQHYK